MTPTNFLRPMHASVLRSCCGTVTLLLLLMLAPLNLMAQQRRVVRQAPAKVSVDAAQKAAILKAFGDRLTETYTFPKRAASVIQYLNEQQASGAYDAITDGFVFATELTNDLRTFTEDFHFSIVYDPQRYAQIESMGAGPNPALSQFDGPDQEYLPEPGTPEYQQFVEPLRRRNFNFSKLAVLDGNIGYLRIETMPPLGLARATVDAAMAFLANTDALVIDLRDVPGGVGGFIPYLMSYFFPEGNKLLFTREFPFADTTLSFYTYADLPSPRLDTTPLYILTSSLTGSAAENLAYTLQQHGRATVVGEATAGGAHSSSMMLLADGFVAQIPIARVVHPVSGSNWQGAGVQPDLRVPTDDALYAAQADALKHLLATSDDPQYRPQLEGYLAAVQAASAEAIETRTAGAGEFTEYEGTYETRRILVENGTLKYQREGGPAVPLARIEGDLFRFDLPPNMRSPVPLPTLRFDRDASGNIIQITSIKEDGTVQDVFEKVQ